VTLLHCTGADAGRRCIHLATMDGAGRLRAIITPKRTGCIQAGTRHDAASLQLPAANASNLAFSGASAAQRKMRP
jgi:hypothetical protein